MLELKNREGVYQQGDVILVREGIPIPELGVGKGWKLPKRDNMVPQKNRNPILAEGETTNHKHQFFPFDENSRPQLYEYQTQMYLTTTKGGVVRHEEHKPISLPPGNFQVLIVREYDHLEEETRRVVD